MLLCILESPACSLSSCFIHSCAAHSGRVLQNYTVDECGTVHIVIGDGGNIEGLCKWSLLFASHPTCYSAYVSGLCVLPGVWAAIW